MSEHCFWQTMRSVSECPFARRVKNGTGQSLLPRKAADVRQSRVHGRMGVRKLVGRERVFLT
jgi:hypothetical protein